MPRSATIIVALTLFIFAGKGVKADPLACPTQPPVSSIKDLTYFVDECPMDIWSPDKMFRLHVSYPRVGKAHWQPTMTVYWRGRKKPMPVSYKGQLIPPTGVMWSPTNQAIAMLDERGSGQDGILRVFVRNGDSFAEDPLF